MSKKQSTEAIQVGWIGALTRNNGLTTPDRGTSSIYKSRTFNGQDLPGYKELISRRLPATTPLDAMDFKFIARPYTTAVEYAKQTPPHPLNAARGSVSSTYRPTGGYPSAPAAFSGARYTSAYNLAVGRLYDQIRTLESRANVGEDLGEISQTYRMVRRPMAGLLNLTQYVERHHSSLLRKHRANNVKQTAKALADLTLEYRFGIKPLINSFADAYVSLENRDILTHYAPFNASGKGRGRGLVARGTDAHGSGGASYDVVEDYETKVRFKGFYKISSKPDRYAVNRSLGLTWRESIPTLYNLIPYSFLLDYVVNLHQVIESVAVPWTNVAWCNMTERAIWKYHTYFHTGYAPANASVSFFRPGYTMLEVKRVRRTDRTSSIPVASLMVKRPSTRQLTNVIALLASRLPVMGRLTKHVLKSPSGKDLDYRFKLATRDRSLKVPYPQFTIAP